MKVLIVEDELAVALQKPWPLWTIPSVAGLPTASKTVNWLQSNPAPDLVLMDIELGDGESFEIFKLTEVKAR
jgi:response regulator of citrate/malate metabolism